MKDAIEAELTKRLGERVVAAKSAPAAKSGKTEAATKVDEESLDPNVRIYFICILIYSSNTWNSVKPKSRNLRSQELTHSLTNFMLGFLLPNTERSMRVWPERKTPESNRTIR